MRCAVKSTSTSDERSAGNRHATFCGNRGQFVAPRDPVLRVQLPRSTYLKGLLTAYDKGPSKSKSPNPAGNIGDEASANKIR